MVGLKKIAHSTLYGVLIAFLLTWVATPVRAVEVAPRISDREIIESLAELKAGQKGINQRIDGLDKRIDGLDKRIDGLRVELKQDNKNLREELKKDNKDLQEEIKKNNKDLREELKQNSQILRAEIDSKFSVLIQLFIAILAMICALIGFIIWDRRAAVQPIKQELDGVKQELGGVKQELDLQHQGGSLVARLVKVFREQARTDGELATILRSVSLL